MITGSLSIIPVPDAATLARYTRQVYALSPYSNARLRAVADRPSARPPVRHVVYVIRENRTYDQVFGDITEGNGDRGLAIFNDTVTPNAHAIARRWVLFDNFYVDGEVSADGHEWTDRAFAGDYNEKTWPQIYSRRRKWDLTSGEDLANPRDRERRALALPVLHALHVHAQRLAPRRRLRVVEPEPLDELGLHVPPRIGDHHVIERPLVRAAPATDRLPPAPTRLEGWSPTPSRAGTVRASFPTS